MIQIHVHVWGQWKITWQFPLFYKYYIVFFLLHIFFTLFKIMYAQVSNILYTKALARQSHGVRSFQSVLCYEDKGRLHCPVCVKLIALYLIIVHLKTNVPFFKKSQLKHCFIHKPVLDSLYVVMNGYWLTLLLSNWWNTGHTVGLVWRLYLDWWNTSLKWNQKDQKCSSWLSKYHDTVPNSCVGG